MPRRHEPEKLDKVAKIKIGASIAALVVALFVLFSYFTGFSIFGSGQPKPVELTPAQVQEVEKIKQEQKKMIENPPTAPGGRKPVIVGS